jgi:uncharacterized protein YlxW (UPF0749 family)
MKSFDNLKYAVIISVLVITAYLIFFVPKNDNFILSFSIVGICIVYVSYMFIYLFVCRILQESKHTVDQHVDIIRINRNTQRNLQKKITELQEEVSEIRSDKISEKQAMLTGMESYRLRVEKNYVAVQEELLNYYKTTRSKAFKQTFRKFLTEKI